MAVDIKYYPEDLGKDYGSLGIKFPMNGLGGSSSGGVFNMSYTTEEQAVSNYINLLLTKKGERYMQPTYGVGLQLRLFEPNTDGLRTDIELDIRQQAQYWLPYIVNHNIQVQFAENIVGLAADVENAIQIVITFSVTESGANKTIRIFNVDGITRAEVS